MTSSKPLTNIQKSYTIQYGWGKYLKRPLPLIKSTLQYLIRVKRAVLIRYPFARILDKENVDEEVVELGGLSCVGKGHVSSVEYYCVNRCVCHCSSIMVLRCLAFIQAEKLACSLLSLAAYLRPFHTTKYWR